MALQHPSLIAFNGGKWSRRLRNRTDLEDYDNALEEMTAFIPTKYGEAEAMTGFLHGAETKHNDRDSVLIPFQYSATDSLWIELGHLYIRIVDPDTGSYIESGGSPVELVSPYSESEISSVQFHPVNDLVILTHRDHPPQELNRISNTSWTIGEFTPSYPPLLTVNSDKIKTITPSGTTGSITLTATGHTPFTSDHIGSFWGITHKRDAQEVIQAMGTTATGSSVKAFGNWKLFTKYPPSGSATFSDTIFLERSEDSGSTWSVLQKQTIVDYDITLDLSGTINESDILLRVRIVNNSGTPLANSEVVLTVEESDVTGLAEITGFTSTSVVSATVVDEFESATASWKWQEGAWSDYQGWPKAATTFESRLFFAGTYGKPTGIWASETDGIDNFRFTRTDDSDPFFRVIDNSQNEIQWLSRRDRVFIGTAGEEFYLTSSSNREGLTPANVTVKSSGNAGSASISPVITGGGLAFVTLNGLQLRELSYNLTDDAFTSDNDLTELSDEITSGGIKQIAFQQYPNRTIYCAMNDGRIAGMVYDKRNSVNGWFERTCVGEFVSVVSTRNGTGSDDSLGAVVKMDVNGTTKRFIWSLSVPSDEPTEWVFLDAAVVTPTTGSAVITGLDHLEGYEVVTMVDGSKQTNKTVVSGQITLDKVPAVNSVVGLEYDAEIVTLPISANTGDGNPKIKHKTVTHIMLGVRESLGGVYGYKCVDDNGRTINQEDDIYPIDTGTRVMGTALQPVTRFYRLEMEDGHFREFSIRIKRNEPFPLNISHAIPAVAVYGD